MSADLILANQGIQYASGNLVDLKVTMPASGSYVAGDIVFESTTGVKVSGWKRLTTGSAHVLNTDWVYFQSSPVLGTAVATTSGTAFDFTNIPVWAKRIKLFFCGVSTNGTSAIGVKLGTSGGLVSTGYTGICSYKYAAGGGSEVANSAMFQLNTNSQAAYFTNGVMELSLVNPATNTWLANCTSVSDSANFVGAGMIQLSGTLTQLRVTTANGTDTGDAGFVNIMYE